MTKSNNSLVGKVKNFIQEKPSLSAAIALGTASLGFIGLGSYDFSSKSPVPGYVIVQPGDTMSELYHTEWGGNSPSYPLGHKLQVGDIIQVPQNVPATDLDGIPIDPLGQFLGTTNRPVYLTEADALKARNQRWDETMKIFENKSAQNNYEHQ